MLYHIYDYAGRYATYQVPGYAIPGDLSSWARQGRFVSVY